MTGPGGPPTVGVNLLWLVPGVVGGSEEYTVNLLRAASDLQAAGAKASPLRLRVYAQPTLAKAHPDLAERFEVVALPLAVAVKPARFAVESSWLAWRSRRDQLVHHGGGVAPYGTRGRLAVTLHDLQPLELPQNFSPLQRRWFAAMLPRVARVAERVLTPSAFTAQRAVELLGLRADRISVVPPVHLPPASAATDLTRAEGRGSDAGRYLLYPAVSHPHKRHRDLIDALHLLADRHPDLRLVFTGAPGASATELARRVVELGLESKVEIRGRVSADELEQLFRGATALVFPSVYEGFGNPVIEAMSHGVPVVAARAASLPEVAGGAAVLVEPESPQALAAGIEQILTDSALAERLVAAGRVRAADFAPEVAGKALLDAYGDALA